MFNKICTLFILFLSTCTTLLPTQALKAESSPSILFPIERKVFTHSPKQDQQIIEGEIIVKFKKSSIDLNKTTGRKKADSFQQTKNLNGIDEIRDSNIRLMKIQTTTAQALSELKNDPNIEYAQPNFRKFLAITNANDTYFSDQWDLSKIQAPLIWDNEAPSDADVTVAVIDTGVYYDHEDLLQNMWDGSVSCKDDTNATISGGCQNHGWDYKDDDNNPIGQPWLEGSEDVGPHGTWVSGIIAATTNNSVGISGISLHNNLKIMALRFNLDTISELKAINFAKNNGAAVINASFGGPDFDQAEKDAIASFPGIFVAAAGNSGFNNDVTHNYPSGYDNSNIISVAATDQNDNLASFSNYGATSVDIAAPGVDIPTTYFNSLTTYASVDGTSFSAPIVAGAVAMIESKNSALTTNQVKNYILNSGDQLPNSSEAAKILSGKRLNLNNAYLLSMTPPLNYSSVGVFKDGTWYLDVDDNGTWDGPSIDKKYSFGYLGTTPISGDWGGSGKSRIGTYDGKGAWYLDINGNGVWDGPITDKTYSFGYLGTSPISGDWNGDGKSEIGVYDGKGAWYLDMNGNGAWDGPVTDKTYSFGFVGTSAVSGDWDGNGTTEIAVYDGKGKWYLDMNGNGIWDGAIVDKAYSFGYFGTSPTSGDWDDDGKSEIGVYDGKGKWYLDIDGNGTWDGATIDKINSFGFTETAPISGKW